MRDEHTPETPPVEEFPKMISVGETQLIAQHAEEEATVREQAEQIEAARTEKQNSTPVLP